ncbi:MAG TPA: energy transducer TonB [Allosphingosinicella sp.]|nr:energy transducer TonB [Allosphingosinicella sp.]
MRKLGLLALTGALFAGEAAACENSKPAVVGARANADLVSLFSDQDYPPAALRTGQQGAVGYTLDVGANGRVTGRTVTQSSGSATLDDTTCRLLRSRARFTPALDDAGAAVPDHVNGRIVWILPPPPPLPPAPAD